MTYGRHIDKIKNKRFQQWIDGRQPFW